MSTAPGTLKALAEGLFSEKCMNINSFKISALHTKGAPALRKDVLVGPGQAQALKLQTWVTLRDYLTFLALLWPRSHRPVG